MTSFTDGCQTSCENSFCKQFFNDNPNITNVDETRYATFQACQCCCFPWGNIPKGRNTTLCQSPISTQLLIQNQRRVSGSLYTMNLGVQSVNKDGNNINWNQSSDRHLPSNNKIKLRNNVPSRGSSTRSSITRLRPGSLKPGGRGVDIKHNSYARYLARKKGDCLTTENIDQTDYLKNSKCCLQKNCEQYKSKITKIKNNCPITGNKIKKFGLLGFNNTKATSIPSCY